VVEGHDLEPRLVDLSVPWIDLLGIALLGIALVRVARLVRRFSGRVGLPGVFRGRR
jgi:hypothetical protein